MTASVGGHGKIVRALIRAGANVNLADRNRWTALMRASSRGDIEIVRALIDAGTNIDAINNTGWSALIIASIRNNIGVVRLLLDAGADVLIKDYQGRTVLSILKNSTSIQLKKLLQDASKQTLSGVSRRKYKILNHPAHMGQSHIKIKGSQTTKRGKDKKEAVVEETLGMKSDPLYDLSQLLGIGSPVPFYLQKWIDNQHQSRGKSPVAKKI